MKEVRVLRVAFPVSVIVLLAACGSDGTGAGAATPLSITPSAAAPTLRPADALLRDAGAQSLALQRLVELQISAEVAPLLAALESAEPELRARAAYLLASLPDPGAQEALVVALGDPDPRVRADAAFALGRRGDDRATAALAAAVARETDADVRLEVLDALGYMSSLPAVDALLAVMPSEGEEVVRTASLARLGAQGGVESTLLRDHLVHRLSDPDPLVRVAAADFFAWPEAMRFWDGRAVLIRQAMEGYEVGDPAAISLARGLGQLHDFLDGDRLRQLTIQAPDWRLRVAAASGLDPLSQSGPVLLRALDDPSPQVVMAAALMLSADALDAAMIPPIERWVSAHPERWQPAVPLVTILARLGDSGPLLSWMEHLPAGDELVWDAALEALAYAAGPDVLVWLGRAAAEPSERIARAALDGLRNRWEADRSDPTTVAAYFEAFRPLLDDPRPWVAQETRRVLAAPEFADLVRSAAPGVDGGAEVGVDVEAGPAPVSGPEVQGMLDRPRVLDWALLTSLGERPVFEIETPQGVMRVRLVVDQAPLTVQTIARLANQGSFDGVPFHRVVPSFVAQAGDIVRGNGTGDPGFSIPVELTRLEFERGVIGMANTGGNGTESTQFFLTQSRQTHLDGEHTAFGWVIEGLDVLDRTEKGDRIVRARVVPGV